VVQDWWADHDLTGRFSQALCKVKYERKVNRISDMCLENRRALQQLGKIDRIAANARDVNIVEILAAGPTRPLATVANMK
jgi:hypothetical protein